MANSIAACQSNLNRASLQERADATLPKGKCAANSRCWC